MSADNRILVVGTTPDYVEWIDDHCPGRALFLTDPTLRRNAREAPPDSRSEVLADLSGAESVWRKLDGHIDRCDIHLVGVVCFDDESMALAANLADRLNLPYPSERSINLCRDKFRCKQAWASVGVPTARAGMVESLADASSFLSELGRSCVLKPLTGAGSEFVFHCCTEAETQDAVKTIRQGLHRQRDNRLYTGAGSSILAEEFIVGEEFSCDFMIDDHRVTIIRLARKILLHDGPSGTVLGYVVPAMMPPLLLPSDLANVLGRAASSLGLSRALCMADFIVREGGCPVLLEVAPRPGGDCLPHLLRHAAGIDMLKLTLDFAEGRSIMPPAGEDWTPMVGLRIHARREGVVRSVDVEQVRNDPRVREVRIIRQAGHNVVLPPEDYGSWLLGHVIFRPTPGLDVEAQCHELLADIHVTFEGDP